MLKYPHSTILFLGLLNKTRDFDFILLSIAGILPQQRKRTRYGKSKLSYGYFERVIFEVKKRKIAIVTRWRNTMFEEVLLGDGLLGYPIFVEFFCTKSHIINLIILYKYKSHKQFQLNLVSRFTRSTENLPNLFVYSLKSKNNVNA